MRYELYQIAELAMRDLAFRPYDEGRKVEKRNYRITYAGEDTSGDHPAAVLENLFRVFNVDHPADFKSYSMSVGDVVVLEGDRCYYCDTFGFVPLEKGWE